MNEQLPELPAPTSVNDMYLSDQCRSLRSINDALHSLVELLTPKPPPALAPELSELREPAKTKHRDTLIAAERKSGKGGL